MNDGHERGRNHHDNLIQHGVAPQRRQRAEDDAGNRRAERRNQTKLRGGLHAIQNNVNDLTAALLQARPEVQLRHHVAQIRHILFAQRLVQPVLGLQRRLRFRGNCLFTCERSTRNRVHHEERHRDDNPDGQQRQQHALEDIKQHLGIHPLHLPGRGAAASACVSCSSTRQTNRLHRVDALLCNTVWRKSSFSASPCSFLRTKNAGRSFVLHHGNEVNYSAAAKLPKISSGMFSSASPTSLLATWNVTARTVSSSRKVYSASTVSPGVYIRQ